ncbi:hypothetical protein OCF65_20775 [Bacillus toyonensis]|uniref:hypothetical protein n=1 Tax=Bacillus toyonensis TaxID=155322 RepID=UPI0001A0FE5D|nr:hypothetical protein [Bacillus toyonensis]EEL60305.1 hypothetical protein bcere0024_048240 [Bacillus cereus Rock4-18]MCU4771006.1 hypothetical protein [Bacillus toyonensis]MCU5582872.1 hypothetical protein [Bacillus toyonensis]
MKTKDEEKSSTVEKVTVEGENDWYVKELKKTLYTSIFSLLVSIAILIFIFYRS